MIFTLHYNVSWGQSLVHRLMRDKWQALQEFMEIMTLEMNKP